MSRREDWPERLHACIEAARGVPFGYGPGENHCCLFTMNAVLAMTDRDPMAWFRGKYKDERGAYVALRRFAGGGLAEAMARAWAEQGWEEVPTGMAQRGDVVLHDTPDGEALGICIGATFVSVTKDGVTFLPMSGAQRAWKVE